MSEWILILATSLVSQPTVGSRYYSLDTVGGFKSQASCEAAGQTLVNRASALALDKNNPAISPEKNKEAMPVVKFDCVYITK